MISVQKQSSGGVLFRGSPPEVFFFLQLRVCVCVCAYIYIYIYIYIYAQLQKKGDGIMSP